MGGESHDSGKPESRNAWMAPWHFSQEETGQAMDDALELACGARTAHAAPNQPDDDDTTPDGHRPHEWIILENGSTGARAYVRTTTDTPGNGLPSARITSVLLTADDPNMGGGMKAGDLTDLPLAQIQTAITWSIRERHGQDHAIMRDTGTEPWPPSRPLRESGLTGTGFLALVARQYLAIERDDPDENPVMRMAEINHVSRSTVRRWLAAARKAVLLKPRPRGRRPRRILHDPQATSKDGRPTDETHRRQRLRSI